MPTLSISTWSRRAIVTGGIAASLYAGALAATGTIELGVVVDEQHNLVAEVTPDTFGWDAGFREGQRVLRFRVNSDEGGWALQTAEANGGRLVLLGPAELLLRASATLALLGLALGVLALPVARLPERRRELLALIAIGLAALPVALAYERTVGLAIIGLAGVGPWLWLALREAGMRRLAVGGAVVGVALWAGWVALRLADPVAAALVRNTLGVWIAGSTGFLVLAGARVTPRRVAATIATTQLLDLAVIAGATLAAVVLLGLGTNPLLAAVIVILPLVLLAGTRRRVADGIDRVLLAELREREAIRATEEERARVSREIHDDPLQQIAGVIRSLEDEAPDTAAARDSLRDVAAKLRGVATELHPPVLDDLGLAPALEAGARLVTEPRVGFSVVNRVGYTRAQRPPAEVELAIYRITQEALANAVRHAGASVITISGEVAPTGIAISVADDGVGTSDARLNAALRDGRMGMTTMRSRAAAIQARLTVERGEPSGTIVSVRWHP